MFINPKIALSESWITGIKNPEKQIQPNAIDFTADKAFKIDIDKFYISERKKYMRSRSVYEPQYLHWEEEPCSAWIIEGHDMLDFLSDVYVDLPEGVAAQLVIRSTLARNGLILTSGIYDSGFRGHVGFVLHNLHDELAIIAPNTRVGQIAFVRTDISGTYAGQYNHESGTILEYQK